MLKLKNNIVLLLVCLYSVPSSAHAPNWLLIKGLWANKYDHLYMQIQKRNSLGTTENTIFVVDKTLNQLSIIPSRKALDKEIKLGHISSLKKLKQCPNAKIIIDPPRSKLPSEIARETATVSLVLVESSGNTKTIKTTRLPRYLDENYQDISKTTFLTFTCFAWKNKLIVYSYWNDATFAEDDASYFKNELGIYTLP
jgi:hypothetical protein